MSDKTSFILLFICVIAAVFHAKAASSGYVSANLYNNNKAPVWSKGQVAAVDSNSAYYAGGSCNNAPGAKNPG